MTETQRPVPDPATGAAPMVRLGLLAIGNGAVAGALAAATFGAMLVLQHLIWRTFEARWAILPITVIGGAVIGWTLSRSARETIEDQISEAADPETFKWRDTAWLALGAVAAVAFGGAVGPEAGIIAVSAQLSSIVAMRLGRSHAERALISEAGVSGALSGFYGSPLGGAVHAEADRGAPKPVLLLAGIAGLATFLLTANLLLGDGLSAMRLPYFEAPAGGFDVVFAFAPAAAGAAVGALFLAAREATRGALAATGAAAPWHPVLGGAAFGLLATAYPVLLFSGHHELDLVLEAQLAIGLGALALAALGKAVACGLCIGSGWNGGVIFPMAFAGAAAGKAVTVLVPGIDPTLGIVAGMTAASAVGMARPVVAGFVLVFLVGGDMGLPVLVGALVGLGALRLLPSRLAAPQHIPGAARGH